MDYFLPSYIQKRLLRFALSYVDFLETDDFDLDKLGVTIGKRNVIELKDVGLRIKVCWYLMLCATNADTFNPDHVCLTETIRNPPSTSYRRPRSSPVVHGRAARGRSAARR